MCARFTRVVLNASAGQRSVEQNVASRQNGQRNQYCVADELKTLQFALCVVRVIDFASQTICHFDSQSSPRREKNIKQENSIERNTETCIPDNRFIKNKKEEKRKEIHTNRKCHFATLNVH